MPLTATRAINSNNSSSSRQGAEVQNSGDSSRRAVSTEHRGGPVGDPRHQTLILRHRIRQLRMGETRAVIAIIRGRAKVKCCCEPTVAVVERRDLEQTAVALARACTAAATCHQTTRALFARPQPQVVEAALREVAVTLLLTPVSQPMKAWPAMRDITFARRLRLRQVPTAEEAGAHPVAAGLLRTRCHSTSRLTSVIAMASGTENEMITARGALSIRISSKRLRH